jgi:hypothetical protein
MRLRAVLACLPLLALPAPPAHASGGAVVLTGGFTYRAGVGAVTAVGTFWAVGSYTGPVTAYATVFEADGFCPVGGWMDGQFSGAFNADFTLNRTLVTTAVVTTRGDITGNGVAEVAFTDPVLPCGQVSDVTAVITIAGT